MQKHIDAGDDGGGKRRSYPKIHQQKCFIIDFTRRLQCHAGDMTKSGAMKTNMATTSAKTQVLIEKYASHSRNRKAY